MSGLQDSQPGGGNEPCAIRLVQPRDAYDVHSLRFRYQSTKPSNSPWIVEDVSFQVAQGQVLGIVGPNGSGKTSLLKLLARLATPQQGGITLFGRDLAAMKQEEIARIVGVVPQDTPQLFPFTVAETVLMGRFPHRPRNGWGSGFGWESGEDVAIAEDAMRTMDVAHLAQRAVTDLSGGERQRTMIARALAQTPQVLLLDEPTAFLDLQHQVEIGSVLCRLRDERGLTVILISHDLNLVSQYCDRLLLLAAGHVVRLGTPDEVIEPLVLEQVYRCQVLIDQHPTSGIPRVTLPGRKTVGNE